jgi:homoserine kinase type II
MACLTPLALADAQAAGADYGLSIQQVWPLDAGSVNSNFRFDCADGQQVFGRIYEEQGVSGAESEIRLLHELAGLGVATTAPLKRLDGKLVGSIGAKPFALYPWVNGEWLCHQRLQPAHCRALGKALACVHLATPQLSHVPEGRFGMPQIRERLAFVKTTGPRFAAAAADIEQHIQRYEAERDHTLPVGLVHGDLFRDNVLWHFTRVTGDAPTIAALLDFESASRGVFVYDLMVCVLSWCFTDSLQLERVHALLDGYEELRPLSSIERAATTVEGKAVCLRFATTRITDFAMRTPSGETPKRDFRRFLLRFEELQRGVMASVWQARDSRGRVG